MKITLSNIITIENPTKEVMEYCVKKLSYPNPQYARVKALGYSVYKVPKDIKLYNIYGGNLYVPYGFFEDLWKIHPVTNDYIDYTTTRRGSFKSNIKLRDYQEPCIRAVKEHCIGILAIPVGLGKTQMAIQCSCETQQKTLWITHTGDLLRQSKERVESNVECSTSTITEGKCDISGDFVFATMQTLIKYIEEESIPQDTFGLICVDEIQILNCNPRSMQMLRQCVEYWSARYRISLSGSLYRSDGLEKCIEAIMGHPIYSIYQKKDDYVCEYNGEIIKRFPIDNFSVRPRIIARDTNYTIDDKDVYSRNGGTIEFASLISDLAMDKNRNKLILKDLKMMKESTILLSDRISQLEYFHKNLEGSVIITGDTPKKDRVEYLNQMRTGEKKYLLSSYQLCKAGLDIPVLVNLFMATPVKATSSIIQSIGRVMRISEGKKQSNVYDYVDSNVGMLLNFYSKRRAIYRKNGWVIDNMYLGGK